MEITIDAEKIAEAMVLLMEGVKAQHGLPASTKIELLRMKCSILDDIVNDDGINHSSDAYKQMFKAAKAKRP